MQKRENNDDDDKDDDGTLDHNKISHIVRYTVLVSRMKRERKKNTAASCSVNHCELAKRPSERETSNTAKQNE